MAIKNQDGRIAIAAGQATTPRAVLVDAAGVLIAGAQTSRKHVGVTTEPQATSGKPVTVDTRSGHQLLTAAAAIAAGDAIYYDVNGTVGKTASSNTQIGIAITAASGAGGIFEACLF